MELIGKRFSLAVSKEFALLAGALVLSQMCCAQLSLSGQIRPRTEFRDGYSTLQKKNEKTAVFTSQRTRINLGYAANRFRFYVSAQDARVWGQDASTINRTTTAENNGIQWHEAWAEVLLLDKLYLKIGRQELSYDDQKLMGGLDWLQQARYHDAMVLKYSVLGWKLDLGAAFNQNKELLEGSIYNGVPPPTAGYSAGTNALGTNYKSLEYVYLSRKISFTELSLMFLSDNFNKYVNTVSGNPPSVTKVNEQGIWTRNTAGLFCTVAPSPKFKLEGSYYHQWGHDKNGRGLRGDLASISARVQMGSKLSLSPGVDFLSGNDGTKNDPINRQFDPLYGTPHKFWGNMDYFYASSSFGSQGLLNYFIKTKYSLKSNWTLFADLHGFESANNLSNGQGGTQNPYLGCELDLKMSYKLTNMIELEAGYSYMKATQSMASAQVKNVANANLSPQWAYMMINLTPDFLSKAGSK